MTWKFYVSFDSSYEAMELWHAWRYKFNKFIAKRVEEDAHDAQGLLILAQSAPS